MKHIDKLISFLKVAGAKEETDTERNGFLSYHAESHAVSMGAAAGYTAVAFNEASLLGMVYGAAAHGRVAQSEHRRRKIFADCKQEPHYALAGVVTGGVAGSVARLVMGQSALPSVSEVTGALSGVF